MWALVAKTLSYVNSVKVLEGTFVQLGTALLPENNPKPDNCVHEDGKYYCSCKGHLCNQGKPMCSWIRKCNPENKRPINCFEDSPKRSGKCNFKKI